MPKKLSRYHREVFFPEWTEESINIFFGKLKKNNGLCVSVHSMEKIVNYCFQYGRQMLKYLLKSIRRISFTSESIFEFYAVDAEIKKACLRFSFEEFPVDLVLVVSADGTVITVYVTNKGDKHDSLDIELYERS
jgi:hypothetical protein